MMKWLIVGDSKKKVEDFANTMRMNGYGVTTDSVKTAGTAAAKEQLAIDSFDQIVRTDGVIMFTTKDPSLKRQTVLGIALATNKRIVLIGEREQPFQYLAMVDAYPTVHAFLDQLASEE